jgi:glutamine amidotransferase
MKVAIVDYGMGNIHSLKGALNFLEIDDVILTAEESKLTEADKLILPGVGSFGQAMNEIKRYSLDKILLDIVLNKQKPILGICLGMQIMSKFSSEGVSSEGLGFVNMTVERFEEKDLIIPHVGFNQINIPSEPSKLFKNFEGYPDFYFTHSYKMIGDDNIIKSTCDYGGEFIAAFEKNNIAGVQFHPELSQKNGLKLINNFLKEF